MTASRSSLGNEWTLRAEGVNFGATLLDTNDLSTIRGAGLSLLEAAPLIEQALIGATLVPQRIFAGASQVAFRFSADAETAMAALASVRNLLASPAGDVPLQHLIFVVDLAEVQDADEEAALRIAEARNRARQFRNFTAPVPRINDAATQPDRLDHMRAAETQADLPGRPRAAISYSVLERRDYGRRQRSLFYAPYLPKGQDTLPVCGSFQDIVDNPPQGLPVAPRGKLAFIYGDGNSFGAARRALGVRKFAAEIAARQANLLQSLTAWLLEGVQDRCALRAVQTSEGWQARFETLLWGGDDFLFVMPAWLGLPVLAELEAATRDWQLAEHKLSCAFGVAICDVKTPVRIARKTAQDLMELAKEAAKHAPKEDGRVPGSAAIQIFESQSPLDSPLATQRSRLFGIPEADGPQRALGHRLVLHGIALVDLVAEVRRITDGEVRDGKLSPPVIHRAIAAARKAGAGLTSAEGEAAAEAVLDTAFGRFGLSPPVPHLPGFGRRGWALDLCLLAMLRDYCALSDLGDPPPFPVMVAP